MVIKANVKQVFQVGEYYQGKYYREYNDTEEVIFTFKILEIVEVRQDKYTKCIALVKHHNGSDEITKESDWCLRDGGAYNGAYGKYKQVRISKLKGLLELGQ